MTTASFQSLNNTRLQGGSSHADYNKGAPENEFLALLCFLDALPSKLGAMIPSSDEFKSKISADKLQSKGLSETRGMFGNLGSEFREFIARGNAVDLAVGVSIGTAFSSLIQSFVQNIVSPPIRAVTSAITGAMHSAQAGVAGSTGVDWTAPQQGPGAFLGQLGTFVLLGLSTFVVVKIINRFKRALERRALEAAPDSAPDAAHEDPTTRVIAQNDRIIELLEQLNARPRIS